MKDGEEGKGKGGRREYEVVMTESLSQAAEFQLMFQALNLHKPIALQPDAF